MKKLLLATVAALSLTTAAVADPISWYRTGKWFTIYQRADDGTPMCRMSAAAGHDRTLHVKWSHGRLWIHAVRTSWRIPRGTTTAMQIQFDSAAPFIADTAFTFSNGVGGNITNDRQGEDFREFLEQFGESDRMYVRFPNGNEPGWTFDMTGSRDASNLFLACIGRVERGTTQPHNRPQPTQPFERVS